MRHWRGEKYDIHMQKRLVIFCWLQVKLSWNKQT